MEQKEFPVFDLDMVVSDVKVDKNGKLIKSKKTAVKAPKKTSKKGGIK